MRKYFLLLFLLLPLLSPAQDRWVFLDSDKHLSVYYDSETVAYYSEYVDAWLEYRFFREEGIARMLMKYRFFYNPRSSQILSTRAYTSDGELVKSEGKEPVDDIIPGSTGEMYWKFFTKNE